MLTENGALRYYDPENTPTNLLNSLDAQKLVDEIPDDELVDFINGAQAIYALIKKENPNAIIMPPRGATPIKWALEAITEHYGETLPTIVEPPLGTSTSTKDPGELRDDGSPFWDTRSGIKGQEKIKMISAYLDTLFEVQPDINTIAYVDEVIHGGTMSQHATHIRAWLNTHRTDVELISIAAQDTQQKSNHTDSGYIKMLTNKDHRGPTHKVEMRMPHIDTDPLLPMILRQDPNERGMDPIEDRWILLEKYENEGIKTEYQNKIKKQLCGKNCLEMKQIEDMLFTQ